MIVSFRDGEQSTRDINSWAERPRTGGGSLKGVFILALIVAAVVYNVLPNVCPRLFKQIPPSEKYSK